MTTTRRLAAASAFAMMLFPTCPAIAGAPTVGVLVNGPEAFVGYTLFTQLQSPTTYLVDNAGRIINTWQSSYPPGNSQYVMPNGDLLRTGDPGGNPIFLAGGDSGVVQRFDWDGALTWEFFYTNNDHRAHHDVALLPNGNLLILAWELRTTTQAVDAGRNPVTAGNGLWPEHIVEVQPSGATGGTIVWEWHVWDHLIQDFDGTKDNFGVVANHPELIDINFAATSNPDWLHANAIDYNPCLDQVMISSPRFNEFWVIDHSTTTAEAAGHTGGDSGRGGDLLYRWGNPHAYDAGTAADRRLWGQHDAHWIDDGLPGGGNIIVFNNGAGRPAGAFSTIDEIIPPVDEFGNYAHVPGTAYTPADPTWLYTADPPGDMYSSFISGCQRLANGNTLMCEGASGDFREVRASDSEIVWRYVSPATSSGAIVQGNPPSGNLVFRAERYAPDFPGFAGRDLTPGRLIELYPGDATGDGLVAFDDILAVIQAWGPCPVGEPCYADLDGNGSVGFGDILEVIENWG